MIFIDFETRSEVDLKRAGPHNYVDSPTTEILCLVVYDSELERLHVWTPHESKLHPLHATVPISLRQGSWGGELDRLVRDRPAVAHNAYGFDCHVWHAAGLPEPLKWIDTLPLTRRRGLPGALGKLGAYLYGEGKDKGGEHAMKLLSFPDKLGRMRPVTSPLLTRCIQYCIRDVMLLHAAWRDELHLSYRTTDDETLRVDTIINERGFCFDRELAEQIAATHRGVVARLCSELPLSEEDLRSRTKLLSWLREHGLDLPDSRRDTLEEALDYHDDFDETVLKVLLARLAVGRITGTKLDNALERVCSDGRIRGSLVYHGAHTGRWSGRGFQPHNLPRTRLSKAQLTGALQTLRRSGAHGIMQQAKEWSVRPDALLSALVRSCVRAPEGKRLCIVDYSQVEARALCWAAGDSEGLKQFKGDPYRIFAAKLFGVSAAHVTKEQRHVAKCAILGAGYGMGASRFEDYAAGMGADLDSQGLSGLGVIRAWRKDRKKIAGGWGQGEYEPGLWQQMEQSAISAVRRAGTPYDVGACTWQMDGPNLTCRLPSGRELLYRNPALNEVRKPWDREPELRLCYDVAQWVNLDGKPVVIDTWGGKLVENVVQAICRDLLAESLCKLENLGVRTVLHVHDEIIAETDGDDTVSSVMCNTPAWARGLPVEVDGDVTERWVKV